VNSHQNDQNVVQKRTSEKKRDGSTRCNLGRKKEGTRSEKECQQPVGLKNDDDYTPAGAGKKGRERRLETLSVSRETEGHNHDLQAVLAGGTPDWGPRLGTDEVEF